MDNKIMIRNKNWTADCRPLTQKKRLNLMSIILFTPTLSSSAFTKFVVVFQAKLCIFFLKFIPNDMVKKVLFHSKSKKFRNIK